MSSSRERTTIRPATAADAAALAVIYNHYVIHTVVTFEEEPVAASDFAARIEAVQCEALPWLVAEQAGRNDSQHLRAKELGKTRWFESSVTRIARVERIY
jgi:hypothetical protein